MIFMIKLCKPPERYRIETTFRRRIYDKVQIKPGRKGRKSRQERKIKELMSEMQIKGMDNIDSLFKENGLEAERDEELGFKIP